MTRLLLNRFDLKVKEEGKKIIINFFEKSRVKEQLIYFYCARYKPSELIKYDFILNNEEVKLWLKNLKKENIKDEDYTCISFFEKADSNKQIELEFNKLPFLFQKKYIKELLIIKLHSEKFIIEPYREGVDFSFYENISTEVVHNDSKKFKKYIRYDVVIYKSNYGFEISVSVGSQDTYIDKFDISEINLDIGTIKVLENNFLIKKKNHFDIGNSEVKANFEIRKHFNLPIKPRFTFYKNTYEKIQGIISKINKLTSNDNISISCLFKEVTNHRIVDFENNKMIFGNGQEDYSTINGMRDYGPFKKPDNIENIQLLFIYPDSESANKLYSYLSRGYRHFPGLESYVGIPANISNLKIKYEYINKIDKEISEHLNEDRYDNIIAVCIMPFSKTTANAEQSKIYFKIKKLLLEKNIPSQFIERNKIFNENFHFSLPNIAIGILAKIGGIPWKLKKTHYDELIVGFNIFKKEENNYLGSCVYFDNEGVIKNIEAYNDNSIDNICNSIRDSIKKYQSAKNSFERVIFHYYKPLNNKENKKIENILSNFKDISFVVVEINDTKVSTDICFDLDYERLMPQSGTYVSLSKNEYLLFNNLRYWEKPLNPINQEEYPIKIKIYDPANKFDHHILISQVYEFSRLYWKSLKQKAQPVTTIYSKLIAEYVANFENNSLPNSSITKNTVWFI